MTGIEHIARLDKEKSDRSTWNALYKQCAFYGMPFEDAIISKPQPGAVKTTELANGIGCRAAHKLASALYAYSFPHNRRWFALKVPPGVRESDRTKKWCSDTAEKLHLYLATSNFPLQASSHLWHQVVFGTAAISLDEGRKHPLNFKNYHIASVYFLEDYSDDVDTVYREFSLTARQAVQQFGKNTPEKIIQSIDAGKYDREFEFVHAVYPRKNRDRNKLDAPNRPWASEYIFRGEKAIIEEDGHFEMPYMISRFIKASHEKMGRGPVIQLLPELKMLNRMEKTFIKANEKQTDPPILVPSDGAISPLRTGPGGIIYYTTTPDEIKVLEFKGNLSWTLQHKENQHQVIEQGFFLDLFQVLLNRKNMTATEVMERIDEQQTLLSPMVGRNQKEFTEPILRRAIGILGRLGIIDPIPPEILESGFEIEYLGKLALAVRALEGMAVMKTVEEYGAIGEMRPSIFDNLNWDESFRRSAVNNGVSADLLIKVDDVNATRQMRAQEEKEKLLIEKGVAISEGIRNVAKAEQAVSSIS